MTVSDGFINHLQLLASCFHNHRCELLIAIPVLLQKEITSSGPRTQPPRYMLKSCLCLYCRERAARPEAATELVRSKLLHKTERSRDRPKFCLRCRQMGYSGLRKAILALQGLPVSTPGHSCFLEEHPVF